MGPATQTVSVPAVLEQPAARNVSHVINTEGNQFCRRRKHMDAALPHTLQVDIPCVLKCHP